MDLSNRAPRDRMAPAAACTLRVEAVFRDVGERHVQAVAAAMIDRAHELANLPECECDVDVSVQWELAGGPAGPEHSGGVPASGPPSEP
jgi:hypothetical protein